MAQLNLKKFCLQNAGAHKTSVRANVMSKLPFGDNFWATGGQPKSLIKISSLKRVHLYTREINHCHQFKLKRLHLANVV